MYSKRLKTQDKSIFFFSLKAKGKKKTELIEWILLVSIAILHFW